MRQMFDTFNTFWNLCRLFLWLNWDFKSRYIIARYITAISGFYCLPMSVFSDFLDFILMMPFLLLFFFFVFTKCRCIDDLVLQFEKKNSMLNINKCEYLFWSQAAHFFPGSGTNDFFPQYFAFLVYPNLGSPFSWLLCNKQK